MFDVFDPGTELGRVYQVLVSAPRSSIGSIADRAELPEATVRQCLDELSQNGIVASVDRGGEIWDAKRPDIVAADSLRRFESWRIQLYETEARLTETFRFARLQNTGAMDIEILDGPQAVFERFRTIQERAHTQVRAIDRPPYYWDEAEIVNQERIQSHQMSDGVSYRTIYQESQSDSPVRHAGMRRSIANGENARVLADPPIKVTIVDADAAIIALDPPPGAEGTLTALLVHNSALLLTLMNIFETLWRLAVPVNLTSMDQELTGRELEILTLMASGAGDDAIARRLGLSRRTIVRHVGRVLEHLGATTRFQAGAQAARRGWL